MDRHENADQNSFACHVTVIMTGIIIIHATTGSIMTTPNQFPLCTLLEAPGLCSDCVLDLREFRLENFIFELNHDSLSQIAEKKENI